MQLPEPFKKPFECFDKSVAKEAAKIKKGRQYKKRILALIEDHKYRNPAGELTGGRFYNLAQIADALGVSRQILYTYKLQRDPEIYSELIQVRGARKSKLQKKMEDSSDPRDRIAAFRLLADDDELERLNTTHKITGQGDDGEIEVNVEHSHGFSEKQLKAMPESLVKGLLEFHKNKPTTKPESKE